MNGRRRHECIFRSHSGYFHVRSLCPCSSSRLVRLLISLFILIHSRWSDAVQVTSGYLTVVEGATVVLPCKLTDTAETLTQISWQRRTRGKPQNDIFCEIERKSVNRDDDRFNFIGNLNEKNGSLQLSDVTLLDEGVYSCIFTLSLTGNYKAEVYLTVLVPPVTCVMGNAPVVGDEEVCLATCTAAGSRPPARVQWRTDTLTEQMRTVTESTRHPNGTTTTVSSLLGVPTREIKNCLVQCVITSPALPKEKTLPFSIQVSSGCINTTAHQSLLTVTLTLILLLTHC